MKFSDRLSNSSESIVFVVMFDGPDKRSNLHKIGPGTDHEYYFHKKLLFSVAFIRYGMSSKEKIRWHHL
jgi:hypothetical protein